MRPALAELWGRGWVEWQSQRQEPWKMERWLLFLFLITSPTECFNFTQQPEQKLSFGRIFKPANSAGWIRHCFHVKHLEINEFWLRHGRSMRLIWDIINKVNQCQQSDQFRLCVYYARQCVHTQYTSVPNLPLSLTWGQQMNVTGVPFSPFLNLCSILWWYAIPSWGRANSQCQKGRCPGACVAELLSSAHKGNVAWGGWLRKGGELSE